MQKLKFLIVLLICGVKLSAQSSYQSEKIFVHTDRDSYAAGDTIWLKSYVFDATSHQLSKQSQVMYVLFQNKQNKIIKEAKVAVMDGYANSQIVLPKNIASGQYEITAYTNFMRNYNASGFYTKAVKVTSLVPAPASTVAPKTIAKPEVHFFPEGGTFISGISSKMAVKLNGFPTLIKGFEGRIEDSNGKLITTFYPDIQKIGTFVIRPEMGMKYYAVFSVGGKNYKEQLPRPELLGYVLNTDNVVFSDGLLINVYTNVNEPAKFNLKALQRGKVIMQMPFETINDNFKFILKNEFVPNPGVVEIVLEDERGKVICERLAYFLNNTKNSLSIQNYKPNLLPKGKVNFDLSVLDDNQRPMAGLDLSVSITDITPPIVFSQKIENMQNSLVFDADFDTEIQKLDSLFEFQPTISKFYLDNLLLTMDWKKEPLSNSFVAEKNILMKATANQNQKPVDSKKLGLYFWDKIGMKYAEVMTDTSGNFEIRDHWTDSVKVLAANELGEFVNLKFEGIYTPNVENMPTKSTPLATKPTSSTGAIKPAVGIAKPTTSQTSKPTSTTTNKTLALKEVVVMGQKSRDYKNDFRRKIYNWEADFESSASVDSSLGINSVAGLIEFKIPELVGKLNSGNENWIMLDGQRIPLNFLNLLKPQDIVWLDYLKNKEKTAKLGQENGTIVNLLSAKGKDMLSIFKGGNYQTFMGYTYPKSIYSPQYLKASTKPDRRKTLYWNPLLKTDIYGKANISFYNADLTKKYLITVYGTDGQGKTISQRMVLK
jgi:hypothetical protein